ncbi:two-component system histidine kinase PnpS [Salinibacillus xinjiangensis]|uniref:histidine kinase n=1 Tax=Salinibacillus xinjiangensis TaxID=1229268 RepID=A0A6G1X9L9_9BACI|nr:HAMP domain-containing sensor histidine kinase [Salinibacillus xinjiangensis]MRG87674.1 HAMP domain-containing protein [Salinibacillus xinjiangensis]
MKKSSSRTFLTYAILIMAFMIVLGFLLVQITKKFMLDAVQERVFAEGSYIVSMLDEGEDRRYSNKLQQLQVMSEKLDIGLVLYNHEEGAILNTSSSLDELNNVPVINTIESRIMGNNRLERGLLKDDVYYYPFYLEDEEAYLVLTLPIQLLTGFTFNVWLLIGFVLAVALVVIFVIGYHFKDKYIKPIRSAAGVARKLAEGNYNARTYETQSGEGGQLTNSINLLAQNLYEMNIQREMQTDRLIAVVENMDSGLVLINEKGYIQLINRSFLDTFQGDASSYIGYLYYDAIAFEEVHNVVRDVFMLEDHVQKTMVVHQGIERRFFAVSGAPIFNHNQDWKGVVLVLHDITEMKRLEEMRKDFVANVSHELRTPITSIKGFSETLLGGAQEDSEVREQFLNIIYKESERLQLLIGDLLELSKLEKEDFPLDIQQVSVATLFDDVLSLVRHIALDKEILLEVELKEPTLQIEVDSARFTQLLLNLLTNAIQYTPKQGMVTLMAFRVGEEVCIKVKDTGIGIPKEHLSRIFERFYRVDKARSRDSGGTGLGLAIVKHIVEAHDGKITVDSEPNKGTTFTIMI